MIEDNGKELRGKELLDKYSIAIEGEDEKTMKHRKEVIKKLQKAEHRRWLIKYITNNVGRGPKRSLKQIKIIE